MNKNKGFTLVELLAVIAILAILVLIALPNIIGMFSSAKKGSFETEAKQICSVAQSQYITDNAFEILRNQKVYYCKTKEGTCNDAKELELSGRGNIDYLVVFDTAGKIELLQATDGEFQIEGRNIKECSELGEAERVEDALDEIYITMDNERIITHQTADKCWKYQLNEDNTARLVSYNGDCTLDVVIPAYIDGYKVTIIHQYAFHTIKKNSDGSTVKINSVYIPTTVKEIGSRAFMGNNLTSIEVPGNVKTVSDGAFANNKISDLVLHEGTTTLGAYSFQNNKIAVLNLPDSLTTLGACSFCQNPIPNPGFLYKKKADGTADYTTVRGYIGPLDEEAFPGKVFTIPAEVDGVALTTIASSAFYNMALSNWTVVIPDTVTEIQNSAFNASGIGAVNLPDGLRTIGSSAFYNNKIKILEIPSSVKSIGTLAFNTNQVEDTDSSWIYKRTADGIDYSTIIGYAGKNRNNIVIPPSKNGVDLVALGSNALNYLSLTGTLRIPPTVKTIPINSLSLNKLTNVDNGDGVDYGGPFVFERKPDGGYDKTKLLTYMGQGGVVTIPDYVTQIDDYAFYYSYVTGVNIPEGVTSIGKYAFQICKLTGSVEIPSTVTYIGTGAFQKVKNWSSHNIGLVEIKNKTGRVFDWKDITAGSEAATFETGTAKNWYGDIEITK